MILTPDPTMNRSPKKLQEWIDRQVWEIFQRWYQPGRQDRSRRWVYRTKVRPVIPMSERTFQRCLEREEKRRREWRRIEERLCPPTDKHNH